MTEHQPTHRTVERHCDVVVIGASSAAFASALRLVRGRRSVIVVDAGGPHTTSAAAVPGHPGREDVRRRGVEVLDGRVTDVARGDGSPLRLVLAGGHVLHARRAIAATGPADVGVPTGIGADGSGGRPVPGVQVIRGDADGRHVAATIAAELADEDRALGGRAPANQVDWEHRYGDERIWSGNPNGSLVAELADLRPGTALDVGAGEGADAIWLAERGWTVTATDISARALDRLSAEADRRGLTIDARVADANVAVAEGAFDLVTAMYASIPRTADMRGVANLLGAVAPGGTLLVVGHDLKPMRGPIDTGIASRAFDPDAYVRVDDVAAVLVGDPRWRVDVHELRPRPAGSATGGHHVDDVVLRARRIG